MKLQKYLIEAIQKSILDISNAHEFRKDIEKKIKAPYVHAEVSTLGGKQHVSILIRVSLDNRKDWENGIFHNSRYMQFHIQRPNIIELFTVHHELHQKAKFRKSRAKSQDDAIKRINDYIKKVA